MLGNLITNEWSKLYFDLYIIANDEKILISALELKRSH